MKAVIIALVGLGLCAQGRSETVVTTDGATYNNISTQRVEPDGLYLEYTIPGGGIGMSKVKFTRLSGDLQKQYGYDAGKAADYEAKAAKAAEDYRQQCIKWDQAADARRAAEQAQEDKHERALNDRLIALAQLKQAEANLAQAGQNAGQNTAMYGGGYWGGDGYSLIALPTRGQLVRARTDYAPVVTPVPFPKLNMPNNSQPIRHQSVSHPVHSGF